MYKFIPSQVVLVFLLCGVKPSVACVSDALLQSAESESRLDELNRVHDQCMRAVVMVRQGKYSDALVIFGELEQYKDALSGVYPLARAEALFGAGVPVERALVAFELLKSTVPLVRARLLELVQRLPTGRAAALLKEDKSRPARGLLAKRMQEDAVLHEKGTNASSAEVPTRQRIGVLLPLSGRLSGIGEALLDGMQVALEGITQLVIRDVGRVSAREMPAVVDELHAMGVSAIVGPVDLRRGRTATQKASKLGVPIISLTPSSLDGPTVFHAFINRVAHCEALVRRARRQKIRRFAVIGSDSAYGQALAAAFASAVKAGGGKLVSSVEYGADQPNLAQPAKRLARRKFDGLFIADEPGRAATVLRYVARAGVLTRGAGIVAERDDLRHVQLLAPSEWLGKPIAREDAQYLDGVWIATEWSGPEAPEVRALRDKMRAAHDTVPNLFHAVGYDSVGLVQQLPSSPLPTVLDGLRSKRFQGVLGRTRFGNDGRVRRDLRLYRVRGRGYKRIGTTRIE